MGTFFIPAIDISEVLTKSSMIKDVDLDGPNILLYAEKYTKVLNGKLDPNDE
jgi:predicted metal-dependent RNase